MTIHEVVGVILLVASLIPFSFGYRLHHAWNLASVILVYIDAFFFFTHHMSKKLRNLSLIRIISETSLVRDDLQGFLVDEFGILTKPTQI